MSSLYNKLIDLLFKPGRYTIDYKPSAEEEIAQLERRIEELERLTERLTKAVAERED